MVGPRALGLLTVVLIIFLHDCEAHKKRRRCKYNGKKYKAGEVIEALEDNCVEFRCSKKGKKTEHKLMQNCVCGKEGNTTGPSTNVTGDVINTTGPSTNVPGDVINTTGPSTNVTGNVINTTGPSTNVTGDVIFTFVNWCTQDLWVGADGRSNTRPSFVFNGLKFYTPNNGGWYLPEGGTSQISVPFDFTAGRFWARTGCTGTPNVDFHCETGDCGPWIESSTGNVPRGGVPPATLAEFTLNAHNQDYYDISLVDGFNLPMKISVATYDDSQVNPGEYWCNNPKCLFDINSICPSELSVKESTGRTVACYSACSKFNTDEYCCRGQYGVPSTCTPDKWPVNYPHEIYEAHCPQAYSYAYDDNTSTFVCRNTNYKIDFC